MKKIWFPQTFVFSHYARQKDNILAAILKNISMTRKSYGKLLNGVFPVRLNFENK